MKKRLIDLGGQETYANAGDRHPSRLGPVAGGRGRTLSGLVPRQGVANRQPAHISVDVATGSSGNLFDLF